MSTTYGTYMFVYESLANYRKAVYEQRCDQAVHAAWQVWLRAVAAFIRLPDTHPDPDQLECSKRIANGFEPTSPA